MSIHALIKKIGGAPKDLLFLGASIFLLALYWKLQHTVPDRSNLTENSEQEILACEPQTSKNKTKKQKQKQKQKLKIHKINSRLYLGIHFMDLEFMKGLQFSYKYLTLNVQCVAY